MKYIKDVIDLHYLKVIFNKF